MQKFPKKLREEIVALRKRKVVDMKTVLAGIREARFKGDTYKNFEAGKQDEQVPKISWAVMLNILDTLGAERKLRQEVETLYRFGIRLRQMIEKSHVGKDLARRSNISKARLSRLVGGTNHPADYEEVRRIATALELERAELTELLKCADLGYDNLPVDRIGDFEKEQFVTLLRELNRGVGNTRKSVAGTIHDPEGILSELQSIRSRNRIIDHAGHLIMGVRDTSDGLPIRICVGNYFGKSDDFTLKEIRGPLRVAIDHGCNVKLLLWNNRKIAPTVESLVELLEFFDLGGTVEARYHTHHPSKSDPTKGIQVGNGNTIVFFPREEDPRNNGAIKFNDAEGVFRRHFDLRFTDAARMAEFFDSSPKDLTRMYQRLLNVERETDGRFLAKAGVGNLLLPQTVSKWEAEHLAHHYGSVETSKLNELKEKRIHTIELKLADAMCMDMYRRKELFTFFKTGAMSRGGPPAPIDVRKKILDEMISWLKRHDNYYIGLSDRIGAQSCDVAIAGESVFINPKPDSGRPFFLRICHEEMVDQFRQWFVDEWHEISKANKNKRNIVEILNALRPQIQ